MRIRDYQVSANKTNEFRQSRFGNWYVAICGLVGEVGSIASVFKKKIIYHQNNEKYFPKELSEELGDAFWYLSNVALPALLGCAWPTPYGAQGALTAPEGCHVTPTTLV